MAWYAHYMSDYDRDTQHLSLTENGAYQRLLSYYYDKRKALPADDPALFRICRAFTPEEQAAVRAVLVQFFNQQQDGWHQKRADEEIQKAKEISAVRANAARSKSNGRTGPAHSEGKAENEKAGGERLEAKAEQTHQQNGSKCSANDPANDQHLSTHITDHNTQITTNNSQITDHKKKAAVPRASESRAGSRRVCDDEFIAELQASDAYKMLNVRLIYNRMLVWCNRNQKPASQKRLIGWLNREDIPMGNGNGSYQENPGANGSSGSNYEFKSRTVVR